MFIACPNDPPELIEAEMIGVRDINRVLSHPKLRVIVTWQAIAISGFLTDDWTPRPILRGSAKILRGFRLQIRL
jgi:hypothetical protein